MKKFENSSNDDCQVSLAEGTARARAGEVSCPGGSHVSCPEGWGQLVGAMYSEFQCIMGNGLMGTPSFGQNDRQTRLKTLPSRNFVGER